MKKVESDTPRNARIIDSKWPLYATTFARMGLEKQYFRVKKEEPQNNVVLVHDDDLSFSSGLPVRIRRDLVEFLPES